MTRARVVELCEGRPVRLVRHGLGRYRRTIADVILPDGRNLNDLLLAEHLAAPYPRKQKPPGRRSSRGKIDARAGGG